MRKEILKQLILALLISIYATTGLKLDDNLKIKGDNHDRLTIQSDLYLSTDNNNDTLRFVLGDSLQQKQEAAEAAERIRLAALQQRSQTRYGGSSGGYGEAKIVQKDTQFFNCVAYAKAMSGINRPIGAGGRSGINTQEARVGEIGVEKGRVHATYVTKVDGDNITILESNFYRGWITMRVLKRSQFIGFII